MNKEVPELDNWFQIACFRPNGEYFHEWSEHIEIQWNNGYPYMPEAFEAMEENLQPGWYLVVNHEKGYPGLIKG